MTVVSFTVVFHGPFRVGSTYARDGVDAALDRHDPLPPDHLKGLMRASAVDLLGMPTKFVDEVFGCVENPSPWSWSSAMPDDGWVFSHRHRVAIDRESGSARKDHLVLGEQAWTGRARFEVTRVGAVAGEDLRRHVLVLRAAGSAVHGLGSWRRRGLGWVGVTPDDGHLTRDDIATLLAIAGGTR